MIERKFARVLRGFCRRVPFRPFVVVFNTGERLVISHPEALYLTTPLPDTTEEESQLAIYRAPDGRYRVFDATSVNQLMDVSDT